MTRQEIFNVLVEKRDTLRRELSNLAEEPQKLSSSSLADAALDSGRTESNLHEAERITRELVCVDRALAKMNKGGYGVCEGCGERISKKRLDAVPCATHCIKCQRKAESQTPDFAQAH